MVYSAAVHGVAVMNEPESWTDIATEHRGTRTRVGPGAVVGFGAGAIDADLGVTGHFRCQEREFRFGAWAASTLMPLTR